MYVSRYNITHYFLCWCGAQHLLFCLSLESVLGHESHSAEHMGIRYAVKTLPIHPIHMRKVMEYSGSNIRLSLRHTIPSPVLICCQIFVILCESWDWFFRINDTVWSIWGLEMLSKAFSVYHIHLQNVMEYSSSIGWLSLRHTIPFPVLMWYPKLVILIEI